LFSELATEAEARKVLYGIHEIRENEQEIDMKELQKIFACLSMVHFLAKENDKAVEIGSTVLGSKEINETLQNAIKTMIDFIRLK